MNGTSMPFVAVIGGLWGLEPELRADAITAANSIGKELAVQGFGLVVYFSNPESLEPHVVSGYVANLPPNTGAIHVRYAQSQSGMVRFAEEANRKELFMRDLFPGDDWEAPFYRSLVDKDGVDAVVLLGGARSTLIAGQIAVARGLPVLPVDSFGGSARKIWQELAGKQQNRPGWDTRPAREFIQQLKAQCEAVVAQRKEQARRDRLSTAFGRQTVKVAFAAVAFVLLLLALWDAFAPAPNPTFYPFLMLLGACAAGATGALARTVIWGPEESMPHTSLLLGSVAGFVVGLAYLLPQWVGDSNVLKVGADGITPTHKIQFAYAVLVAISAGVGFDTVFNKLREEAGHQAVGPKLP